MKQNNNEKQTLLRNFKPTVIVFLVLYFGVLLCNLYLHFNPEKIEFIPFDPDIYGSFSDWAMVLVTAVTAYFIWGTLNSQMKVQESQSELLNIEKKRYRASLLPDIILIPIAPNSNPATDTRYYLGEDIGFSFSVVFKGKPINELKFTDEYNQGFLNLSYSEEKIAGDLRFKVCGKIKKIDHSEKLAVLMEFNDSEMYSYSCDLYIKIKKWDVKGFGTYYSLEKIQQGTLRYL